MKLKQKIILKPIWISAMIMTALVPMYYLYMNLFKDIVETKPKINFGISIIFLVYFIINIFVLRRKLRIKEQSISVAEEIGVKPQTNFVIARVIKSLDYIIPGAFFYFFMRGLSMIQMPPYLIFRDILIFFGIGFILFLVHDFLKNRFVTLNNIERLNAEAELIASKLR